MLSDEDISTLKVSSGSKVSSSTIGTSKVKGLFTLVRVTESIVAIKSPGESSIAPDTATAPISLVAPISLYTFVFTSTVAVASPLLPLAI